MAGFIDPAEVTRRLGGAGPRGLSRAVGAGRDGDVTAADSLSAWLTSLSEAVAYLAVGERAAGEAALDQTETEAPPEGLGSVAPGLLEASRGWVLLLDSDTASAIDRMRAGLALAGRWTPVGLNTDPSDAVGGLGTGAALSFRLVAAMASWGPTAEEGRRHLRDVLWPDFHYEVLRHYELARALERIGERAEARESYDRFLRLLEGADEGLLVEDEIERAREAVARLTG